MYRFFRGSLDSPTFISQVEATDPEFPYTEPQIGDYIDLPFNADPLDREIWVIKHRAVYDDRIEYYCERYIWED